MSNILVLDDDSEIVMMIGSYLSQQQDNKVICSYDLDTAYKIIEHRPLDLVITDFQLIGRTSEEFMRT